VASSCIHTRRKKIADRAKELAEAINLTGGKTYP